MVKWEELKFYDWASIRKTSTFLMGVFVLFFFLLNRGHYILMLQQRGKTVITTALIKGRYSTTDLAQTMQGNVSRTGSVTIYYTYTAQGVAYNRKQILYYSIIDAPRLNQLYKSKLPVQVNVIYNYSHPYESSLTFD